MSILFGSGYALGAPNGAGLSGQAIPQATRMVYAQKEEMPTDSRVSSPVVSSQNPSQNATFGANETSAQHPMPVPALSRHYTQHGTQHAQYAQHAQHRTRPYQTQPNQPNSVSGGSPPSRNVFESIFPSLYGPPLAMSLDPKQYQAEQQRRQRLRLSPYRSLQNWQPQRNQPVTAAASPAQPVSRNTATVNRSVNAMQSIEDRIESIKAAAEAAVLRRETERTGVASRSDIALAKNELASEASITQAAYRSAATGRSETVSASASPELYKSWDLNKVPTRRNTSSNPYLLVSDSPTRTPPPAMSVERLTGAAPETRSQRVRPSAPRISTLGIGKNLVKEWRPTNDRTWSQNHAVLQTAEFNGNQVTVRNIRYSKYISDEDYTTRYYDATFNLEEIRTIDLIIVPFHAMPSLAHVETSFGFADGRHLGLSIEARYEEGEKYDPVAASMRQFELIYVFADERDLIRIGTDVNKNDVLLYRLKFEPGEVREMFVDALQRANKLADKPEFYHPLRNSCVTNLIKHVNKGRPGAIPREFRTLLPGLMDHYVFDLKLVDTTAGNFREAKANAKVNWLVDKYGDLEYFSAGIRQNLY